VSRTNGDVSDSDNAPFQEARWGSEALTRRDRVPEAALGLPLPPETAP